MNLIQKEQTKKMFTKKKKKVQKEENSQNEDSTNKYFGEGITKSHDNNNEYENDLQRFITDFKNMIFLKPILMEK